MADYPSSPLTTEALTDWVEQRTGYRPTPVQLRHWVHWGLLPEPEQVWPGSTHGRGSVVHWPAECARRLELILSTRRGKTAKNVSLKHAAVLLMITGCPPLKPDRLRDALKAYVQDVKDVTQRGRDYLRPDKPEWKLDPVDRRERFLRSVRRHDGRGGLAPDAPKPMRELGVQTAAALAGLPSYDDSERPDVFTQIEHVLSHDRLAHALDSIDDAGLVAAYQQASALVNTVIPFLTTVVQAIFPGLTSLAEVASATTERLPASVSLGPADVFRPVVTFAFVIAAVYPGQALSDLVEAYSQMLKPLLGASTLDDALTHLAREETAPSPIPKEGAAPGTR